MNVVQMPVSEDPIQRIRKGDRVFLKSLYDVNREPFIAWVKKHYGTDRDLATEVYQSAFTALYYNVREGKLIEFKSKISTYLFAIGRNQLRDRYKLEKKYSDTPMEGLTNEAIDHSLVDKYENHHLKEKIKKLLATIGDPCKTVLKLFYYKHYSMEAIAAHMNYKTEQIAAKRKFLCLKQLRELI